MLQRTCASPDGDGGECDGGDGGGHGGGAVASVGENHQTCAICEIRGPANGAQRVSYVAKPYEVARVSFTLPFCVIWRAPETAQPSGHAFGMELSTHDKQDASVGLLIKRLVNSSRVTEERAVAKELLQLLDTPAFRAALSDYRSEEGQGGSNGWTETLKAVVIKVNKSQATAEADFVQALSRLVEEADRCGALFDGENVDKVVKSILQNERIAHAPTPQIKKLYWSILSSGALRPACELRVGGAAALARGGRRQRYERRAVRNGRRAPRVVPRLSRAAAHAAAPALSVRTARGPAAGAAD